MPLTTVWREVASRMVMSASVRSSLDRTLRQIDVARVFRHKMNGDEERLTELPQRALVDCGE